VPWAERKNYILELEAFYSVVWKYSNSLAGTTFSRAKKHAIKFGLCDFKAIGGNRAGR
jgi:hypothetical protein